MCLTQGYTTKIFYSLFIHSLIYKIFIDFTKPQKLGENFMTKTTGLDLDPNSASH